MCCLLRDKRTTALFLVHEETENQARASLGKLLVLHRRYASQVLQIRSQYLNPGNYRTFSLIRSITIALAHSDESYMQKYWKFVETPTLRARHESNMRLLETHSNTSERRGNEAGKARQERERKEGLALRGRNKSSTKVIAMPPATRVGRESVYGKAKC